MKTFRIACLAAIVSASVGPAVAQTADADWAAILKLTDAADAASSAERSNSDPGTHERRVKAFAVLADAIARFMIAHQPTTAVGLLRLQYREAVALERSEQWKASHELYVACQKNSAYHDAGAVFENSRIDTKVPDRLDNVELVLKCNPMLNGALRCRSSGSPTYIVVSSGPGIVNGLPKNGRWILHGDESDDKLGNLRLSSQSLNEILAIQR